MCIHHLSLIQPKITYQESNFQDLIVKMGNICLDHFQCCIDAPREKGDIAEEIDRLDMHLKEFVSIMSGKSDLIGKKLDFFCQELAREANTIASKSKNAELTRLSVNLKSYVEKLRQQVQNIQ